MVRLKKINILLLMLVFSLFIYGDKCLAYKNVDVFNELLKVTNNQIVEIGLKAEYKTNNNGEKECINLLNNLNLNLNSKILINNSQSFHVEFAKDKFSGYIESTLSEGDNVIVINIIKKTKENDLEDLEKRVSLAAQSENVKIKLFKYLKAKLSEQDLLSVNKRLVNKAKSEGAYNISSIPISNGYSTVLNTNNVNLNYVLCNYSSGDYILIGTPEIIASY